ncbi:Z1 domain-containing protein [Neobacillus drentensis]|uniref:Z1 domain-containing protein n=1 Tax=Neobacillus drentensis TaxID=220684 RepID=UPI000824DF33|nr:Z1 domain-containing protein [Neobacillus drentensis]
MNEDDIKVLFEKTFSTNYYNLKSVSKSQDEAAENAINLARIIVSGFGSIDESTFEMWSLEMFRKYKIGTDIIKPPPVMRPDNGKSWFSPEMISGSFFWTRYRQYLTQIKGWPMESVEAIDDTTNEIMKSLGNPQSMDPFDKRGIVLGFVQSGKTANFTGLINKAYDVGYKLIIVLSGIHNDLRAQTQIRLNQEVIGTVDKEGKPIGVGQIYQTTADHIITSWTTEENDISSQHGGIRNLNSPTLMVVKKNKTVLESLRDQLIYHRKLHGLDIPVLIVDDEADQASVDTSDPNKDEDPKTINRLIRQLLEIFSRKAYAGYTATPFANLLISTEAATSEEGNDLYPKDFLVGLPKPKDYCGPEEFFNVEEDAEDKRPSLIRYLRNEDTEIFTTIKKKADADKFEEVPPQMREAILAFLLTISIRNLRGQRKTHNSMLIHTSRFKDVQSNVKDEVARTFESISNQIQYNPKSKVLDEIMKLYEEDFQPTTKDWPGEVIIFSWNEVYEELRVVVDIIKVFEINGNSKDALAYNQYKEDGLNVIAVGGDKLSRGLTLEGLSITYYFRNTLMYDTLMQMGRWFGYRKGYMDLCRIYTSEEIASNFEHLAIAMVELREEFDRLAEMGKTPSEYAVRMLSHPTMTLTSPLKMRNAISSNIIYGGTLQQTRLFGTDEQFYKANMKATESLVNNLTFVKTNFGKGKTSYYVDTDVKAEIVKEYLSKYETKGTKAVSGLMRDYIGLANENGELLNWTVAIVEGDPGDRTGIGQYPVSLGSLYLESAVGRGTGIEPPINKNQDVDIKAIVAANQEYIDIDPEKVKGKKDRMDKRKLRPKESGLLLIYPLNPNVPVFKSLNVPFSEKLVPVGVAISFPFTEIDETDVYQTNKTVH